jgi:pyruvate dehydrogenase E2 component (dihydrolipoamide acetyltransferase)
MISKAMMNSLSTTSQLTLTTSFDATELMALRKKLKQSNVEFNVTLTDMILYAVSRVLKDFPALNAHFLGDTMRYFDQVHLGLAVDTDRGLLVPTIFNADTKSLVEISNDVKSVAQMSKTGTINPDLLTGASFTITNLGTFGIESFTPVLNAPQTGILGVNTITQRVRETNGAITTYPAMGLSLTFDHSAIDGAPAARFLQSLTKALENFTILLMQ